MELAEWQDRDWRRAQRWADACTRGDCKYAVNPETYAGDGCPGYHCTLYYQETRPTLRYCLCVRRQAWHKFQREQRRPVQRVSRRLASDDA